MKFTGKTIVGSGNDLSNIKYKVINHVLDYENNVECVICKTLNPDFSIILPSLSLIITETGSVLSHLAILARERNIPVVLISDITSKVPETGVLNYENGVLKIEK